MRRFLLHISILLFLPYSNCAWGAKVNINQDNCKDLRENTIYVINSPWDLKGDTLQIPQGCTLFFKKNGRIENGLVVGIDTKIKFIAPFIGKAVSFQGCRIVGKRKLYDKDVFITVNHSQQEIQTFFDIGNGIKLIFSQGVYENIEKIQINNNVDACFSNSTIKLNHDQYHIGECFYMEPWVNKGVKYCRIKDLTIEGGTSWVQGATKARRCIQLFFVSEVVLDNITFDKYYSGPSEYEEDSSDLLDKSRIGTCAIAIMKYDKCIINDCSTNDVSREIFWCVPNNNPRNITYFTNNKSAYSSPNGSDTFFTLIDGSCIVKNNEVHNYAGSAFNVFCYDSEISDNKFVDGKRSVAIDLSEGEMYRANNVFIHNNKCVNSRGLVAAYGETIRIKNNSWSSSLSNAGENRCTIITINKRGPRKSGGQYIGSDNNPVQDGDSKNILISDNTFNYYTNNTSINTRGVVIYGDCITVAGNKMSGFEAPVVQFVEGRDFEYTGNIISKSPKGSYAELLINDVENANVSNNVFCQCFYTEGKKCAIYILKAAGSLNYRLNNVVEFNNTDQVIFVPCFIKDYSALLKAVINVDKRNISPNCSTGIDKNKTTLRTNLKN